jgi:hypothetical protein
MGAIENARLIGFNLINFSRFKSSSVHPACSTILLRIFRLNVLPPP